MANEQNNNDPKNDPKDQARNLFLLTGLTQAQIAELIGVSQKTISVWMNEGRWKQLKESAEHAPVVLIEQMTSEIAEIHANIAAREPGKRFATPQEAEVRRKTMISIKYLKEQQTTNVHTEVMMNFIHFAKTRMRTADDLKNLTLLADQYLTGERKLSLRSGFQPYSLPGQIYLPPPAGTDITTPPPVSGQNDDASGLGKAA